MNWIRSFIINHLKKDRDRADEIIRTAFKGYHIAKIRKDAGKPKKSRPLKGMVNNLTREE